MMLHLPSYFLSVLRVSVVITWKQTQRHEDQLSHEKSQHMSPAICEVTDDNQRTCQHDCRVAADKTNLHVANRPAEINHALAKPVNQAIDHPQVEDPP